MDIKVTSLGQTPLIEVNGDIDHGSCGAIGTVLRDTADDGHSVILVDLSRVTYIDSGGISVFLSGTQRLRDLGWVGLIGPNPNVRRLLEIVGLLIDPSLRVFDDREAAEAALTESSGEQ